MTLVEFKYIVALARERHFGRAAQACFVSQPTLSVAIKKLEEELGVQIFERDTQDIKITAVGEQIIAQAQQVLDQAQEIRELAKHGRDPLTGVLRLGLIYTIAPYILPLWMPRLMAAAPSMPVILQEHFTNKLLALLKQGELDCALLAEPFDSAGLTVKSLYDEAMVLAVAVDHPWAKRTVVAANELKQQTLLLLGPGHCLRDQILTSVPESSSLTSTAVGIQKAFEGSSLETIRYMVAGGLGVTVLPASAAPVLSAHSAPLICIPFAEPTPSRRVVLVVRKGFNREAALEVLISTLNACAIPGTHSLAI